MHHPRGYTLIELLLVITVISILSVLAITTYRTHLENQRSDKAALEIQNILAAALAYHVDFEQWPRANSDLSACQPEDLQDTFITTYLPNQNYRSNYGDNYCWEANSTDNPGPLFWVALQAPFVTAHRIASQLPNAVIVENPTQSSPTPCTLQSIHCYVRTEVAQPATNNQQPDGQIAGMGYCDPKQPGEQPGSTTTITCKQGTPADRYQIRFACPVGKEAQLYIVPNFYQSAALPQASPPTILTVLSAKTYNHDNPMLNTCQKERAGNSKYTCHIKITAQYDKEKYSVVNPRKGSPGMIGAFYIAYCTTLPITKKITTVW